MEGAVAWRHRQRAAGTHLMTLLQAAQSGVGLLPPPVPGPLAPGPCCAACRMELRFCMGVGWAGCWYCVITVLVLSGA